MDIISTTIWQSGQEVRSEYTVRTHLECSSQRESGHKGQGCKSNFPTKVDGNHQRGNQYDNHLQHARQSTTCNILQHWHICCQTACQCTCLVLQLIEPSDFLTMHDNRFTSSSRINTEKQENPKVTHLSENGLKKELSTTRRQSNSCHSKCVALYK